mgnify:CR=1 FL=1
MENVMSESAKKKRSPSAAKSRGKATGKKKSQLANGRTLDSEEIERAVYDGMQDLRFKKSR